MAKRAGSKEMTRQVQAVVDAEESEGMSTFLDGEQDEDVNEAERAAGAEEDGEEVEEETPEPEEKKPALKKAPTKKEEDDEDDEGEEEEKPAKVAAKGKPAKGEEEKPARVDAKAKPEETDEDAAKAEIADNNGRFPWAAHRRLRSRMAQYEAERQTQSRQYEEMQANYAQMQQQMQMFVSNPEAAIEQLRRAGVIRAPGAQTPGVPQPSAAGRIDPRQIPTVEDDPVMHWQMRTQLVEQQLQDMQNQWNQGFQQMNTQYAADAEHRALREEEMDYTRTHPDYEDAATFLAERQRAIAESLGMNEQQAMAYVGMQARILAAACKQNRKPFAETVHNLAKDFGWATPAEEETRKTSKTKLEGLRKRQEVTRTSASAIPPSSGKKRKVGLPEINSREDLENLTEAQIDALDREYGEGWEQSLVEDLAD